MSGGVDACCCCYCYRFLMPFPYQPFSFVFLVNRYLLKKILTAPRTLCRYQIKQMKISLLPLQR
ncbi:ORF1326 [White spot syndrome virus]|uniref:ORF1326 n=1 Tax=White spot syndrome virus TaxID=342409 RepID=A0A2D3I721_9VIRU|nr:ORF1326 [White spot syndrome virus]